MPAPGICVPCAPTTASTTGRRWPNWASATRPHVGDSLARWADDTGYSWAVCEPTTGELLAEVSLDPRTSALSTRARPGHDDAAAVAADAVRRFAEAFGIG